MCWRARWREGVPGARRCYERAAPRSPAASGSNGWGCRYIPETSTLSRSRRTARRPPSLVCFLRLPVAQFSAFQDALAEGRAAFVEDPAARSGFPRRSRAGSGSARLYRSLSATGAVSDSDLRRAGEAFSLDAAEVKTS